MEYSEFLKDNKEKFQREFNLKFQKYRVVGKLKFTSDETLLIVIDKNTEKFVGIYTLRNMEFCVDRKFITKRCFNSLFDDFKSFYIDFIKNNINISENEFNT